MVISGLGARKPLFLDGLGYTLAGPEKSTFFTIDSAQLFWTPLQVALYACPSTHDQQTLPMQLKAMRVYAKKRGWKIAHEVQEIGSGAKTRPKPEDLLKSHPPRPRRRGNPIIEPQVVN